ncbi:hypothetical protein J6590_018540 [Homalodisca vitripennis]|nr:hypothetical protein J6590_018540 [Homalodisca vitripennis]
MVTVDREEGRGPRKLRALRWSLISQLCHRPRKLRLSDGVLFANFAIVLVHCGLSDGVLFPNFATDLVNCGLLMESYLPTLPQTTYIAGSD